MLVVLLCLLLKVTVHYQYARMPTRHVFELSNVSGNEFDLLISYTVKIWRWSGHIT